MMKIDERGHIHLSKDDVFWIQNKDGKDVLGFGGSDFLLAEWREMEAKIDRMEKLLDDQYDLTDLCTYCNPEKNEIPLNVPDGRVQSTLEVES